MEASAAIIDPNSLRGLAYEVMNQLYGAGPVDDSNITIYQIEAELRHQYGLILEKDDKERTALGQKPDSSRIVSKTIPLLEDSCQSCGPNQRTATLPDFLSWNGQPYITAIGGCGLNFVPVANAWQLPIVSKQTGKATYTIEGQTLRVNLTPQTIGIDSVTVTGILKAASATADKNDPSVWQTAWTISEAWKALIKERAEIRLRGGSVATWQRADKKNNGVETPINAPTT